MQLSKKKKKGCSLEKLARFFRKFPHQFSLLWTNIQENWLFPLLWCIFFITVVHHSQNVLSHGFASKNLACFVCVHLKKIRLLNFCRIRRMQFVYVGMWNSKLSRYNRMAVLAFCLIFLKWVNEMLFTTAVYGVYLRIYSMYATYISFNLRVQYTSR